MFVLYWCLIVYNDICTCASCASSVCTLHTALCIDIAYYTARGKETEFKRIRFSLPQQTISLFLCLLTVNICKNSRICSFFIGREIVVYANLYLEYLGFAFWKA